MARSRRRDPAFAPTALWAVSPVAALLAVDRRGDRWCGRASV